MKNVAGNYSNKHNTKNPLFKFLMDNFHRVVNRFISKTNVATILDIGCGEGFTTKIIKETHPKVFIEGVEYDGSMAKKAAQLHPDIHIEQGTIYDIQRKDDSYELVLCTEVCEHLEEPEKGVKELKRVSKKFVLITVPNEPYWRIFNFCRGKYMKDLGNTPGHLNHWSKQSLEAFLKPHFRKVIVKNALMWNVALCIK